MDMVTQVEIQRPAAEVFAYLADFENNPAWQGGMQSCKWTSEGPVGVGSTYDQVASFLGRPILTSFEVSAFEEGRSISIVSVVSTFPIQVTRSVEPLAAGACRVTANVAGQPPLVMRLMPGMNWMVKRSVTSDYKKLKALLESQRVP